MRVGAEACCCGSSILANIVNAASAISHLRFQTIVDNVKPLQQALGSRQSRPFIVGGLATGVLIYYCGHRWFKQREQMVQKDLHSSAWNVDPTGAEQLLKNYEAGAGDGTDVQDGGVGGKVLADVEAGPGTGDDAETLSNTELTTSFSSTSLEIE